VCKYRWGVEVYGVGVLGVLEASYSSLNNQSVWSYCVYIGNGFHL